MTVSIVTYKELKSKSEIEGPSAEDRLQRWEPAVAGANWVQKKKADSSKMNPPGWMKRSERFVLLRLG